MASTANPNVLDAAGSISKALVKSGFLAPVVADINKLQGGTTIALDDLTAVAGLSLSPSDRFLIRTSNGTRSITVTELGIGLGAARPILTKEDLGLVGNGEVDDAPALQRAAELWSNQGGAAFMLRAQTGKQFYFKGTPRLASNISCIFVSGHRVTKQSRLTLQGQLQTVAGANEFRLLADAAAGDSFIRVDTSPHGGGAVSGYWAVGDTIRIRGLRDSCGTPLEEYEGRVTAVTDGTQRLDVSPALNFSFKITYPAGDYEVAQGTANISLVAKIVAAPAASDVAAGSNLWPIASGDIGKFSAGDFVMAYAENRCSDIGGSSTFLTHVELAQVIASVPGDAAASVRLSRRLERAFATAKNARLIKLRPIRNAQILSPTVEFTEAPDATLGYHPYEIRYGVDCALVDCTVPNQDLFGTRGAGMAIYRSLACSIDRPIVRAQKYVDSGEGNGTALTSCVDCRVTGGTLAGTRHAMQAFGSTNCVFQDVIVQNPRHTPLDCHGGHEVGIRFLNITASAATDYEADPGNAPAAITFGNSTHQAGAHRCGIEGGRFVGFKAADGVHEACIVPFPPSTNCYVRNAEFHRIGILLRHYDIAGSGTLVTSGLRLDGISVDDCADWLVYISGRENGASVDTAVDFAIYDLTARNVSKMFFARRAAELQIYECETDEITEDLSFPYWLDADTCPDLVVEANSVKQARRGIRLTGCTAFRVLKNRFLDLTAGTVWQDGGSNTGVWLDNDVVGTTPTATRTGASIITEGPRATGVTIMADDTAFAFLPERKNGRLRVWSHGAATVYAEVVFRTEISLRTVLDSTAATANVEVTTGVLSGTTGTDAKFTVSAHGTGIFFENRLGSSVTIDFSVS